MEDRELEPLRVPRVEQSGKDLARALQGSTSQDRDRLEPRGFAGLFVRRLASRSVEGLGDQPVRGRQRLPGEREMSARPAHSTTQGEDGAANERRGLALASQKPQHARDLIRPFPSADDPCQLFEER